MKRVIRLTESDLKNIVLKVIAEKRLREEEYEDDDSMKRFAKFTMSELPDLIKDVQSGKMSYEELTAKMKLAILEKDVKYLSDILEDFPEIAEKLTDSYLQQVIGWVIDGVNSNPDYFASLPSGYELDKHEYSDYVINDVIQEILSKFPVLQNEDEVAVDLENYIKFYHDDLLFKGFEGSNL